MSYDITQRLDTSLDLVEPHLSPALVPSDGFARIREVAHLLPIFAVDFFGFECRLSEDAAATDCAINLTPDGAKMLAGRHSVPLPQALQQGAWERIREFYATWADTNTTPYADAGSTWLEFDMSGSEPAPNLLFGYWPQRSELRSPEWLADTIIPRLMGEPLAPAFRRNLLRCLAVRPPVTDDFQIGVMFSRKIQAVRLCVFDLPQAEIFPYLERIGWQGPKHELQAWMEGLRQHSDFVGLHLDIGADVYPHIGIEPNFVAGCWSRQPHKEPRWHGQFQYLLDLGLLAPAKKEALLSWIGHQSLSNGEQETLLLRGLSHLKVVLRPGRPALAKAYFGLAHRTLGVAASHAS